MNKTKRSKRSYIQKTLIHKDLDKSINKLYVNNLPKVKYKKIDPVNDIPAFLLEIPYTISQLAYLTHGFYRYYGKYPSILGGFIIDRHHNKGPIFDNYVGCGTTLVEAKIRGINSSGVDVNPIATLVSNVKTREYKDIVALRHYLINILNIANNLENKKALPIPKWNSLTKWFIDENINKLARIKQAILSQERDENREFAVVCFLSIIRRCSKAYDGEVRPHVNKSKKQREPFAAYRKKFRDMLNSEIEFTRIIPKGVESKAFCASNTQNNLKDYMIYGNPSLIISHPPYLNCFNYYAVFSLENFWAIDIPEATQGISKKWIKEHEHKCWPATNPKILKEYFQNLKKAYSNLRENIEPKAKLAIVIGDSTLRKKLIPVHKKVIDFLPECGFKPIEVLYRTTHYGIGKYAYRHRADYHGNAKKKDGVIVAEAI